MRGCTFELHDGAGVTTYSFCNGAFACQMVKWENRCDGAYDCFDRHVQYKYIFLIWKFSGDSSAYHCHFRTDEVKCTYNREIYIDIANKTEYVCW